MTEEFAEAHRARYGFTMDKPLVVEAVVRGGHRGGRTAHARPASARAPRKAPVRPLATVTMYTGAGRRDAGLYRRATLRAEDTVTGPAIVAEDDATTVVDPGWQATAGPAGHLVLRRAGPAPRAEGRRHRVDPVHARSLQQPLHVDRRTDGRTAGEHGALRQHQGTAGLLLRPVRRRRQPGRQRPAHPGAPGLDGGVHQGGAAAQRRHPAPRRRLCRQRSVPRRHPPAGRDRRDARVRRARRTDQDDAGCCFLVASRGHHAEIGGITPGSMPAFSRTVDEEGVLFDNWLLVRDGDLREAETRDLLTAAATPPATRTPTSPTCAPRSRPTRRASRNCGA